MLEGQQLCICYQMFVMTSSAPFINFFLPSFANSSSSWSICCSCCDRKGRTQLLQMVPVTFERGCSSTIVMNTLIVIYMNWLKKSFSSGVEIYTRENKIQYVRQRMSSSLSVLSRAMKERQAGMRQQTMLVRMPWVLRIGLSRSKTTKRISKTRLGLIWYFCSMNFKDSNLSRAQNFRGLTNLFTYSITEQQISVSCKSQPFIACPNLQLVYALSYFLQGLLHKYPAFLRVISFLLIFKAWDLNIYQNRSQSLLMEDFFTDQDANAPQITEYQPPQAFSLNNQAQPNFGYQLQSNGAANFDFAGQSDARPQTTFTYNQGAQNDFNQFEEDETTKRIREDEERLQNLLREKSQREWNDKNERITQGRQQLSDFLAKKEQEKQERARQNQQKQQQVRQQYNKLKVQQGWNKVILNINLRQGQHKGKKDINRMREAILHRRQDETGR